jgi:pyruvate/2-oxoglutarate dehydrogenase complex dihydrolipoamide dehydrogenase (E3) component
MQTIKEHYPNLIIGFGKGGKTLATYLAQQGQEVVLIERSEMMYGGTCINVACIPTKSLITNAEKKIPYAEAFRIKNDLTSFLRQKNYDNLESHPLITVITGGASFISGHEVRVTLKDSGNIKTISADRIFINSGTEPAIPEIPGLKNSKRVFTSASLIDQSNMHERLVIIGGGFIGLEFANMYSKFGADVTLLDHGRVFLPKEDRDVADEIYRALTERGVRIIMKASVSKVTDTDNGVTVQFKEAGKAMSVESSAVLIATGRKPNTTDLDLEAAAIKTDSRGFISVNDKLQTSANNVWAIGDINGGPQFTYVSLDDFRIVRDQLFGGSYTSVSKRKKIASSVFITPPFAHIGLRENEAKEQGYRIKVAKLPASAIPRARIQNNTTGILKSVIDADTNKILGCTLFCVEASEMINTIQVAINAGIEYQTIRDTVFTHPSMTEALNDLYASI